MFPIPVNAGTIASTSPSMVLNFTSGVLDPRVTFTRTQGATNAATYYNSSGVLSYATANTPRFDYDPVAKTPKGLLIEETRTNILTNSQNYTVAGWTKSNVTNTANSTTSPDGTANASTITETVATGQHTIYQSCSITTGTAYTWSAYVKANGRTFVRFECQATGLTYVVEYDLTAVTVTSRSGTGTGTITSVGNGWYRVTATATSTATGTGYWQLDMGSAANTFSYTGDGVSGIYLFGAQLESGAFATSYIPTVAAAVQRGADNASMTGTNFSSWFNTAQGTFVLQNDYLSILSNSMVPLSADNNAANGIMIYKALSAGDLYAYNGSNRTLLTSALAANVSYKAAYQYNTTPYASYNGANALAITYGLSGYTPTQLGIGHNWFGNQLSGHIQKIVYYPVALSNSQIKGLST